LADKHNVTRDETRQYISEDEVKRTKDLIARRILERLRPGSA
jgi:hypothetical protein